MNPEADFRRLLEKFGELRVCADVESGLYSPVRLAWARAWLADKAAGNAGSAFQPLVLEAPLAEARDGTETAEAREAKRLAADANELAAEARRLARDARATARKSKAVARTARLLAFLAVVVAIATVVAVVALFDFHLL